MPMFKVKVTQVYRVEKFITVEVEAATIEDAIELMENSDAPCSSLGGWNDHWDLQNDEIAKA